MRVGRGTLILMLAVVFAVSGAAVISDEEKNQDRDDIRSCMRTYNGDERICRRYHDEK